jgi:opacity protein-like surface antigen
VAEDELDDLLLDDAWLDALEQDVFELVSVSNYLSLSLGTDNLNNRAYSAFVQLPLGDDFLFDAAVGRNTIKTIDLNYSTNSYAAGIGSSQYSGFNWRLGLNAWGKKQTIETVDVGVEFSYQTQDRWRTSLLLEQGVVTLYLRPFFSNRLVSIDSDRDAWGINLGHRFDTGSWWLSYLSRSYRRNLAALNTSVELQTIIQSIALDQAYALSSDEYVLGYEWYLQAGDLRFELNRVTSAVDSSDSDFVIISHRYYADETWSIRSSLQKSLQQSLLTLNVGVGVSW